MRTSSYSVHLYFLVLKVLKIQMFSYKHIKVRQSRVILLLLIQMQVICAVFKNKLVKSQKAKVCMLIHCISQRELIWSSSTRKSQSLYGLSVAVLQHWHYTLWMIEHVESAAHEEKQCLLSLSLFFFSPSAHLQLVIRHIGLELTRWANKHLFIMTTGHTASVLRLLFSFFEWQTIATTIMVVGRLLSSHWGTEGES